MEDLRSRAKINLAETFAETFIDASFVEGKKGAKKLEKPSVVKALKSWQLWTIDLFLLPCLLRALHHMKTSFLYQRFSPTIAGTYLSDLWVTKHTIQRWKKLRQRGCELTAPHKCNKKKPKTQDGKALQRYRRRWVVARFTAWLRAFRRVEICYNYNPDIYFGFVNNGLSEDPLEKVLKSALGF